MTATCPKTLLAKLMWRFKILALYGACSILEAVSLSENPYKSTIAAGEKTYVRKPIELLARLILASVVVATGLYIFSTLVAMYGEHRLEEDFSKVVAWVVYPLFVLLWFVALIVTAVYVCMFMYRANSNLRSIGAVGLRTTPAWCVLWWFVPILHMTKPYLAMSEIYRCSKHPIEPWWMTTPGSPYCIFGGQLGCPRSLL